MTATRQSKVINAVFSLSHLEGVRSGSRQPGSAASPKLTLCLRCVAWFETLPEAAKAVHKLELTVTFGLWGRGFCKNVSLLHHQEGSG